MADNLPLPGSGDAERYIFSFEAHGVENVKRQITDLANTMRDASRLIESSVSSIDASLSRLGNQRMLTGSRYPALGPGPQPIGLLGPGSITRSPSASAAQYIHDNFATDRAQWDWNLRQLAVNSRMFPGLIHGSVTPGGNILQQMAASGLQTPSMASFASMSSGFGRSYTGGYPLLSSGSGIVPYGGIVPYSGGAIRAAPRYPEIIDVTPRYLGSGNDVPLLGSGMPTSSFRGGRRIYDIPGSRIFGNRRRDDLDEDELFDYFFNRGGGGGGGGGSGGGGGGGGGAAGGGATAGGGRHGRYSGGFFGLGGGAVGFAAQFAVIYGGFSMISRSVESVLDVTRQLNDEMVRYQIETGKSAQQAEQFKERVKEVSRDVGLPMTEVAQTVAIGERAGLSEDYVTVATQLQRAYGIPGESAIQSLVSLNRQFTGASPTGLGNLFAGLVQNTPISDIEGLFKFFGQESGLAGQLGLDAGGFANYMSVLFKTAPTRDEGTIARLARRGGDIFSDTQIRNQIESMIGPVRYEDQETGQIRNMDIMSVLQRMASYEDRDRMAQTFQLWPQELGQPWPQLMTQMMDVIRSGNYNVTPGDLPAMSDLRQQSITGKINDIQAAWQELVLTIGASDKIISFLTALAGALRDLASVIGGEKSIGDILAEKLLDSPGGYREFQRNYPQYFDGGGKGNSRLGLGGSLRSRVLSRLGDGDDGGGAFYYDGSGGSAMTPATYQIIADTLQQAGMTVPGFTDPFIGGSTGSLDQYGKWYIEQMLRRQQQTTRGPVLPPGMYDMPANGPGGVIGSAPAPPPGNAWTSGFAWGQSNAPVATPAPFGGLRTTAWPAPPPVPFGPQGVTPLEMAWLQEQMSPSMFGGAFNYAYPGGAPVYGGAEYGRGPHYTPAPFPGLMPTKWPPMIPPGGFGGGEWRIPSTEKYFGPVAPPAAQQGTGYGWNQGWQLPGMGGGAYGPMQQRVPVTAQGQIELPRGITIDEFKAMADAELAKAREGIPDAQGNLQIPDWTYEGDQLFAIVDETGRALGYVNANGTAASIALNAVAVAAANAASISLTSLTGTFIQGLPAEVAKQQAGINALGAKYGYDPEELGGPIKPVINLNPETGEDVLTEASPLAQAAGNTVMLNRQTTAFAANEAAINKHTAALEKARAKLAAQFEGFLSGALNPSAVTDLQFAQSRVGMYQNQPDEQVRRARSIINKLNSGMRSEIQNGVFQPTTFTEDEQALINNPAFAQYFPGLLENTGETKAGEPVHDERTARLAEFERLFYSYQIPGLFDYDALTQQYMSYSAEQKGKEAFLGAAPQEILKRLPEGFDTSSIQAFIDEQNEAPIVSLLTGGKSSEEIGADLSKISTDAIETIGNDWKTYTSKDDNMQVFFDVGESLGGWMMKGIIEGMKAQGFYEMVVQAVVAEMEDATP